MKTKQNAPLFIVAILILAALVVVGQAQAPEPPEPQAGMGTAFTYQGQLIRNDEPANGAFEFRFTLYDETGGSAQVGVTVSHVITVTDGLFTTNLDFGSGVFTGDARYLEIAVRPQGSAGDYSTLSPRQALTPSPYALYAPQAGAVDWGGITNVPPDLVDGDDVGSGGIQSVAAGDGLTGGGTDDAITLTVTFAGSGSLDASARGDHTHPGSDVAWTDVFSRPAGLDDGDDDTTYTAGVGLILTDTEFSVDLRTVAPLTHTHSITSPDALRYFEQESLIPTHAAIDWEFFTIGSDSYLAVANSFNDSTYNLDSKIYRWNGTSFTETQSLPSHGAYDWEFFTIGSDSYLAVAHYFNGSTYSLDSKIYRWNGTSFTETQSLPTIGAYAWEFFTIGSDSYLAVANRYNGSTLNIDSKIYRWNGASFVEFQSMATNGAMDWEFFTIGSDSYLAVANNNNDSTSNIDSKIYRWNGASFIEFQSIATHSAMDWEFFTIGDNSYLAIANQYNGSYNIDSKIYQWNGAGFVEVQSIPTHGATDWEFFTIGSDPYLAVANYANGSSYNIDSKIYRWNGTSFAETQSILTNSARDWKFFTIGSDSYLAVANMNNGLTNNIDSKIYKATLQSRAGTSYLWGQNGSDVYYNDGNVGIGTTTPQSALQVEGYVQLDVITSAPPAADCDEMTEEGRMKFDPTSEILYICATSGWVSK